MMDAREYFLVALLIGTIMASNSQIYHRFKEPQTKHTETVYYDNLGQQSKDPSVFKFQPVFEGNWVSNIPAQEFDEFTNSKGWARCQFAYRTLDPTSPKMFFLEIVDGVFFCRTRYTWIS